MDWKEILIKNLMEKVREGSLEPLAEDYEISVYVSNTREHGDAVADLLVDIANELKAWTDSDAEFSLHFTPVTRRIKLMPAQYSEPSWETEDFERESRRMEAERQEVS